MATIKSYTDLSQSKKLAEILPLESADYHYIAQGEQSYFYEYSLSSDAIKDYDDDIKYIPCWSLAALLGALPFVDFTMPQLIGTPKTLYRCIYNDDLKSHAYDNAVDACVDMIEKLHELKML